MRLLQHCAVLALGLFVISCKGDSGPTDSVPQDKTITVDITYVSGLIPNSDSWATWPVAEFPSDPAADSIKVRIHNYTGTWSRSEYTKKWKEGELPPTDYNLYPESGDIADGKQFFVLGRTWCSGCSAPDPDWIVNYEKGMGDVKAEVTYIFN